MRYMILAAVLAVTWGCVRPVPIDATAMRPQTETAPGGTGTMSDERVVISPQAGSMVFYLNVPKWEGAGFVAQAPKSIQCAEGPLLNQSGLVIEWSEPAEDGSVECWWRAGAHLDYAIRLVPGRDSVEMITTIRNNTEFTWTEVSAFNLLLPAPDGPFYDASLGRLWMSVGGRAVPLADTHRVREPRPAFTFYFPDDLDPARRPPSIEAFGQTSDDRTDGSWMAMTDAAGARTVGVGAPSVVFLFNNIDLSSLHTAAAFGDIGPGEESTVAVRFAFVDGGVGAFVDDWPRARAALRGASNYARPDTVR